MRTGRSVAFEDAIGSLWRFWSWKKLLALGAVEGIKIALFSPRRLMSILSRSNLALAVIGGATLLSAALGARATRRNKGWYRVLRKSPLTPPDAVFPVVWTTLYGLNALSAARVYRSPPSRVRSGALALWGAQQALNAAWSPLFFGRHRARAALADIGLLSTAIAGYAYAASKVDRTAAALVAPYLGWVGFASFLNEEIVRRNPRVLFRG
jgi:translocator protein